MAGPVGSFTAADIERFYNKDGSFNCPVLDAAMVKGVRDKALHVFQDHILFGNVALVRVNSYAPVPTGYVHVGKTSEKFDAFKAKVVTYLDKMQKHHVVIAGHAATIAACDGRIAAHDLKIEQYNRAAEAGRKQQIAGQQKFDNAQVKIDNAQRKFEAASKMESAALTKIANADAELAGLAAKKLKIEADKNSQLNALKQEENAAKLKEQALQMKLAKIREKKAAEVKGQHKVAGSPPKPPAAVSSIPQKINSSK